MTDVANVEPIGPCILAVLATRQRDYNGELEGIINCRFVLTPECAVALAQALMAAVQTKTEPDAAGAPLRVVN